MIQARISRITLAAMLGDSKINMVLCYAHPTQEHQAKAMEKMERFVTEQQIAFVEEQTSASSQAIQ